MEFIVQFFQDYILHLDKTLADLVATYQGWTYLILFTIIFCETGLVVTPFLPGDSLLFTAGSIAALEGSGLSLAFLIGLLFVAAFLGDTVNYLFGKFFGKKIMERNFRLINKNHIARTHEFYEKHGGKTIILARFVPIVRTFAPFVAGVGEMDYKKFISFNIIGGALWVVICLVAGYLFGNIPFVKKHFELVLLGIIFISLIPIFVEFLNQRRKKGS